MIRNELEKLYLETEHGVFTPIYTYDEYIIDEETREESFTNVVINKTSEEVYQEWLAQKDKTQEPSQENKITLLEEENKQLWDTVEFLLKQSGNIPREDVID